MSKTQHQSTRGTAIGCMAGCSMCRGDERLPAPCALSRAPQSSVLLSMIGSRTLFAFNTASPHPPTPQPIGFGLPCQCRFPGGALQCRQFQVDHACWPAWPTSCAASIARHRQGIWLSIALAQTDFQTTYNVVMHKAANMLLCMLHCWSMATARPSAHSFGACVPPPPDVLLAVI